LGKIAQKPRPKRARLTKSAGDYLVDAPRIEPLSKEDCLALKVNRRVRHTLPIGLLFAVISAIAGCTLLITGQLTASQLKQFADALSPDGVAERYPLSTMVAVKRQMVTVGLGWLFVAALLVTFSRPISNLVWGILSGDDGPQRRILRRMKRFIVDERCCTSILIISVIIFVGLLAASASTVMRVDESATFIYYAGQNWYHPLLVYDSPNNHILHSVLVHLTTGIFGHEVWAVRLPAMAAGALCIGMAYLAMRAMLAPSAGLIAAIVLGSSYYWLDQSVNARGYTIMCLFMLTCMALAPRMVRGEIPVR